MNCIRCNRDSLDLRYLFNGKTFELEYHCTTLDGGCNFYRILPMDFTQEQVHLGDQDLLHQFSCRTMSLTH